RIGAACKSRDRGSINGRPRLGHVEAAIAPQTRESDVDETKYRSLSSGRDVAHAPSLKIGQPNKNNQAGLLASVPSCRSNHRFPWNPRQPAELPPRFPRVIISGPRHKERKAA